MFLIFYIINSLPDRSTCHQAPWVKKGLLKVVEDNGSGLSWHVAHLLTAESEPRGKSNRGSFNRASQLLAQGDGAQSVRGHSILLARLAFC